MKSQRETDVGNQVSNVNWWNRDPDTWSINTLLALIWHWFSFYEALLPIVASKKK